MRLSDRKSHDRVIRVGVAAALIALGTAGAAIPGYAQSSSGTTTSGGAQSAQSGDAQSAQSGDAQSGGTQSKEALVARVKDALHADPTLDDRHIEVRMEHGAIVLGGFVQSQPALIAAGQVAAKAAGKHKIVNHIHIEQDYRNGRGI